MVTVDLDPVGSPLRPVERAPRDDLVDHLAADHDHGGLLVRDHHQLDLAFRVGHAGHLGGPHLDLVHRNTPAERSGLLLSNRSDSRISPTVNAGLPCSSLIAFRIWAAWARCNGSGWMYASRFTSTLVPRGSSQPLRLFITCCAFGISDCRQCCRKYMTAVLYTNESCPDG